MYKNSKYTKISLGLAGMLVLTLSFGCGKTTPEKKETPEIPVTPPPVSKDDVKAAFKLAKAYAAGTEKIAAVKDAFEKLKASPDNLKALANEEEGKNTFTSYLIAGAATPESAEMLSDLLNGIDPDQAKKQIDAAPAGKDAFKALRDNPLKKGEKPADRIPVMAVLLPLRPAEVQNIKDAELTATLDAVEPAKSGPVLVALKDPQFTTWIGNIKPNDFAAKKPFIDAVLAEAKPGARKTQVEAFVASSQAQGAKAVMTALDGLLATPPVGTVASLKTAFDSAMAAGAPATAAQLDAGTNNFVPKLATLPATAATYAMLDAFLTALPTPAAKLAAVKKEQGVAPNNKTGLMLLTAAAGRPATDVAAELAKMITKLVQNDDAAGIAKIVAPGNAATLQSLFAAAALPVASFPTPQLLLFYNAVVKGPTANATANLLADMGAANALKFIHAMARRPADAPNQTIVTSFLNQVNTPPAGSLARKLAQINATYVAQPGAAAQTAGEIATALAGGAPTPLQAAYIASLTPVAAGVLAMNAAALLQHVNGLVAANNAVQFKADYAALQGAGAPKAAERKIMRSALLNSAYVNPAIRDARILEIIGTPGAAPNDDPWGLRDIVPAAGYAVQIAGVAQDDPLLVMLTRMAIAPVAANPNAFDTLGLQARALLLANQPAHQAQAPLALVLLNPPVMATGFGNFILAYHEIDGLFAAAAANAGAGAVASANLLDLYTKVVGTAGVLAVNAHGQTAANALATHAPAANNMAFINLVVENRGLDNNTVALIVNYLQNLDAFHAGDAAAQINHNPTVALNFRLFVSGLPAAHPTKAAMLGVIDGYVPGAIAHANTDVELRTAVDGYINDAAGQGPANFRQLYAALGVNPAPNAVAADLAKQKVMRSRLLQRAYNNAGQRNARILEIIGTPGALPANNLWGLRDGLAADPYDLQFQGQPAATTALFLPLIAEMAHRVAVVAGNNAAYDQLHGQALALRAANQPAYAAGIVAAWNYLNGALGAGKTGFASYYLAQDLPVQLRGLLAAAAPASGVSDADLADLYNKVITLGVAPNAAANALTGLPVANNMTFLNVLVARGFSPANQQLINTYLANVEAHNAGDAANQINSAPVAGVNLLNTVIALPLNNPARAAMLNIIVPFVGDAVVAAMQAGDLVTEAQNAYNNPNVAQGQAAFTARYTQVLNANLVAGGTANGAKTIAMRSELLRLAHAKPNQGVEVAALFAVTPAAPGGVWALNGGLATDTYELAHQNGALPPISGNVLAVLTTRAIEDEAAAPGGPSYAQLKIAAAGIEGALPVPPAAGVMSYLDLATGLPAGSEFAAAQGTMIPQGGSALGILRTQLTTTALPTNVPQANWASGKAELILGALNLKVQGVDASMILHAAGQQAISNKDLRAIYRVARGAHNAYANLQVYTLAGQAGNVVIGGLTPKVGGDTFINLLSKRGMDADNVHILKHYLANVGGAGPAAAQVVQVDGAGGTPWLVAIGQAPAGASRIAAALISADTDNPVQQKQFLATLTNYANAATINTLNQADATVVLNNLVALTTDNASGNVNFPIMGRVFTEMDGTGNAGNITVAQIATWGWDTWKQLPNNAARPFKRALIAAAFKAELRRLLPPDNGVNDAKRLGLRNNLVTRAFDSEVAANVAGTQAEKAVSGVNAVKSLVEGDFFRNDQLLDDEWQFVSANGNENAASAGRLLYAALFAARAISGNAAIGNKVAPGVNDPPANDQLLTEDMVTPLARAIKTKAGAAFNWDNYITADQNPAAGAQANTGIRLNVVQGFVVPPWGWALRKIAGANVKLLAEEWLLHSAPAP